MLHGAAKFLIFLIKLKKIDFSTKKKKLLEVGKLKQSLSFTQGIDIGKGGHFFHTPRPISQGILLAPPSK